MSADESAPTSWQAGAPPLTLTASSSPTDHRNINSLQRNEFDDSDDDGKNNSRDASQSRISDHIEIPKDGRSSDNHEGEGEDDEDGKNNSKKRDQNSARNRRNAPPRLLQGPGLKWHKEYSALDPQAGRVLMIDFARSDKSRSHIRKVAAQEIFTIQGLRRFYKSAQQAQQQDTCAMRVIHVQNADWAIPFLMRKFNISSKSRHSDDGRSDFGRYLRYKNPELRGGKPFLAGRTWKVQYDPWRGVNRTSFGLDYMKSFRVRGSDSERRGGRDRMMQLNDFDQDDEPIRGHDVYVQRLSCYIQHKQAPSENRLSRDDLPLRKHFYPPDVYGDEDDDDGDGEDMPNGKDNSKQQRLRRLDNGNVIIIFDNSSSGNIDDTLIPARRDLECRWRRLPFHLAFESHDPVEDDDARLALHCSKAIVSDIFKSVVVAWDAFLDHAVTHMTILEDKIYERPDDESRAPELWANSSAWLKVEKLVNVHASVVQEMKMRLHELTDDVDTEDNWLDDSPSDFERLTNLITEDLTKPTESLISLLYQSVSIRDSRHSLELGVSMWRLSWITFIFLPLTFIVGFFGMNVDTFSNMPSIKWYFIAAIPFMFGVLTFYFLMKGGSSDSRRRSPRERIVYETFFQEMASRNPTLWSRNGPRDYVRVEGWFTRLKWWLIRYWLRPVDLVGSSVVVATTTTTTATPTRTTTRTTPMINNGNETIFDGVRSTLIGAGDGLSTLSRLQRYLSRRWTAQIANRARTTADTDTEMGLISMNDEEFEELARASGDERFTAGGGDRHHSIGEGLTEVAEIVAAPAVPRAGRPWSSAPSSLDGHDHDHDHGHDSGGGGQTQNTHLTVPGIAGKALWTTTTTTTTTTHDDHDRDRDDDTDEINTSEITNPVIVAALARERARQGRLRSNSSPSPSPSPSGRGRGRGYVQGRGHRRGGSGGSSGGSGSSPGGRNSDRVLVEEEDAAWLNERGRKGKDWIWRFGGGGSVSDDDKDKEKK